MLLLWIKCSLHGLHLFPVNFYQFLWKIKCLSVLFGETSFPRVTSQLAFVCLAVLGLEPRDSCILASAVFLSCTPASQLILLVIFFFQQWFMSSDMTFKLC